MRGNGERLSRFASLVALFRNGECLTVQDAADRMDAKTADAVRHQIKELHDAGLLFVCEWRKKATGPGHAVYGWAEPFGRADESKQEKVAA